MALTSRPPRLRKIPSTLVEREYTGHYIIREKVDYDYIGLDL